jgi:hypothetical protein
MNERIKELIKQCHRPVITSDKRYLGETFDYERFAKLIIIECAKIVNDNDFEGSIVGDDLLFEHFGVE